MYTTRRSDYLTLTSDDRPGVQGVGECATLPDLSCDAGPQYDRTLQHICMMVEQLGKIPYEMLRPYPSILFGLETAFAQFQAGGSTALFDTLSPVGKRAFLSMAWVDGHFRRDARAT